MTPDGKGACVTNFIDNTVSQYTIEPSGARVAQGPCHRRLRAVIPVRRRDPQRQGAYLTNFSDATVTQCTIEPSGALSPRPRHRGRGHDPFDVAVTPDGKSAYVANASDNTVSQYTIDR